MGMYLRTMIAALLLTAVGGGGAVAACDPATAPCRYEMESGVYHAALPDGPGPHPALVFLHGWGGTGAATIRNKGLVSAVTDRGYAFIAPTGQPRSGGRSGASWNSRAVTGDGVRDDVFFINTVLAHASKTLDVDRDRVLIGGFSGGGMMSWRIVCDRPETAAAYAPISGLMWRPLPEVCAGPAKLLHTHGWADPVVPMEGRSVAGGRITQGDLFVGLNLLRDAFACRADPPTDTELRGGYWRRAWTNCAPGAHLELAIHPGGHSIPKGWSKMALDWFEATQAGAEAIR